MPRNRVLSILQEPRHCSSAKGLYDGKAVARFAFDFKSIFRVLDQAQLTLVSQSTPHTLGRNSNEGLLDCHEGK